MYRAYLRQSNVIANRQTEKNRTSACENEKKKKNKVSNSQKKWMEFHRFDSQKKNFKVPHFLLEISVHSKKKRKTWEDIWHFEIWPQLNFRTIFQLSPKLPFHSPLSVSLSISSHFQRNNFFYILFNTSICTKRPQKASEKRPEMEWKKFGEWRNANGMFLSFLPSNFSLVTLIV